MTTTFQKRQREMKKQEKARNKAERRAQRKLEKVTTNEGEGGPEMGTFEPFEPFEPSDTAPES